MSLQKILKLLKDSFFKLIFKFNYNMTNQQDSKKQIREIAKQIAILHRDYLIKLNELKQKQIKIINEFIKKIEKRKMEKLLKN